MPVLNRDPLPLFIILFYIRLFLKRETVGKAEPVTDFHKFLLYRLGNRNAFVLPFKPCQVFLLACCLNTVAAGGFFRSAERPANVSGSFFEFLQPAEEFRIDDKEEMA